MTERIDNSLPQSLRLRSLAALLLAMFAIALGYGFLLPILPSTIARIAGTSDPAVLARHAGVLTGTYTLALFLFAPLGGRLADRYGRRPMIVLGLMGFALSLALFAVAGSLPQLYLGRFLNGMFASAIAPAAYALVGDHASTKEWRAHRFALLNIAGASGFLVGPMLGGLVISSAGVVLPGLSEVAISRSPFFVTAAFAFIVAVLVLALVPGGIICGSVGWEDARAPEGRAALPRLLAISFVTALAVGAFEVGLSLRGVQDLEMNTYRLGLMFTECALVMLIAQSIVFSPLVRPESTRWLVAPSLAILAVGVAAVPFASSAVGIAIIVAMIAASAGILSPVATYWISMSAGIRQGADLGLQTASASLGQATGSAVGGLLFGVAFVPNASFILAAVVVLLGLAASMGVPRLLTQPGRDESDERGPPSPCVESSVAVVGEGRSP
ncbi:MFS transporter [Rhizobium sp. P28RR-XV]|uniref:MFS transporter n=1 Tax=Rhizobium sp. P28RR-XV TaxID=2726737 RepID=UPI001456B02C|nr:MFS transporter [Rhizobium sp. P28RR-XV]NLR86360.1 MFS transporter [Rhizobium sp. P28RR-XV]